MEDKLMQDLKAAMIAKDELRVNVLRSLKSAITYAKVAPGAPADGVLDQATIEGLFAKEAKKRQESAEAFKKAGADDKAAQEQQERAMIEAYLPPKLSEDDLRDVVANVVSELGATSAQQMGQVIAGVKQQVGTAADGAVIAKLVKERLSA